MVVGKAISVAGPRLVLSAIPLAITGQEKDYEFRSSWLLPVLRDYVRNTELGYFTEVFLPLAATCLDRSQIFTFLVCTVTPRSLSCAAQQDKVGAKTYEVLTYQLWSLLPGFCLSPTDLTSSFKGDMALSELV